MGIFDEYYNAQLELEQEYGTDSIVLMMVGSFYELYGVDLEDCKIGRPHDAHDILGMNITLKNKSKEHSKSNPYMVGFPDYALDEHLGKFLRAGITVGIYDQFDVSGSSRKERKRTRVYTPGTFIDETTANTNCCMCIEIGSFQSVVTRAILTKIHVAILSLGKVLLTEVYDTANDTLKARSELYRIIHSYSPSEIIYCGESNPKTDSKFAKMVDFKGKVYFKPIPKMYYKQAYQTEFIKKIYSSSTDLDLLNLQHNSNLIPHLIHLLQFAYSQDHSITNKIEFPTIIESTRQLILNNDSIYQLGIISESLAKSDQATLLHILCKAKTAMGKRLFRDRLLAPSIDPAVLESRWDQIEEVIPIYSKLEPLLRGIVDIEKKYRKMAMGKLHPYEFENMRGTFDSIASLLEYCKANTPNISIPDSLFDQFECFYNEFNGNFDFEIMKKCKIGDNKGSFYPIGVNAELDRLQLKITAGKAVLNEIAESMSRLIDPSGRSAVSAQSTDKEGWYLTTTTTRFKKLPKTFKCKINVHSNIHTIMYSDLETTQLTNTVKIRSTLIKQISKEICETMESINGKITEEYLASLEHYSTEYKALFALLAETIAHIDFIYSAAKCAVENGYTRPIIKYQKESIAAPSKPGSKGAQVLLTGLRHPIVERINETEEYITNDIELGITEHYGSIIYGLNMSGKSTLLKALGCNIVMAQAGLFVSAEKMEFSPFTQLLSKMTIRDDISKGQSTFMIEIIEINNMLMRADANTLILSDELCSSTESTSAHAIVAQTLHALTEKRAKFVFSTHLHDLQRIDTVTQNPHLQVFHFQVKCTENGIIFNRKLEKGGMTDLYGLEVARALGLPSEFMTGAFAIRDGLANTPREIVSTRSSKYNPNVIVHACEKCGTTDNLHTHHKYPQKDANSVGLIKGRIKKNSAFNLQVLCRKCHADEHKKEL